jgi:hypothetical protein
VEAAEAHRTPSCGGAGEVGRRIAAAGAERTEFDGEVNEREGRRIRKRKTGTFDYAFISTVAVIINTASKPCAVKCELCCIGNFVSTTTTKGHLTTEISNGARAPCSQLLKN